MINRDWTILVFMAADNDLDRYALKDIHEMESLGSTEKVAIVVQVDRRGGGPQGEALRGTITKNPHWEKYEPKITSNLMQIGETNTGDPSVLQDFIVWGVREYPAHNYGLVIWNHGSGWKPSFIYEAVEKFVGSEIAVAMKSADFSVQYQAKTRRLVFRKTLEKKIETFVRKSLLPNLGERFESLVEIGEEKLVELVHRAIALDESSSNDALDSIELHQCLEGAASRLETLHPDFRWKFIGFDACLMAGIETCYQLSTLSEYIIGSEEIEPAVGWRYDLLIGSANELDSNASPTTLPVALVKNYVVGLAEYKIRLVTQSAVNTSKLQSLASALDVFASELQRYLQEDYRKLAKAEKTATRFFDTDFIDIGSYLDMLEANDTLPGPRASIEEARIAYNTAILTNRFAFEKPGQNPTGLSIYYPTKPIYEESYDSLSFGANFKNWSGFIKKYHFLH